MAKLDMLALVTPEEREDDGRAWFAVEADDLYPRVLDYMRAVRDERQQAAEAEREGRRADVGANGERDHARERVIALHGPGIWSLSDEALERARTPVGETKGWSPRQREVRIVTLDLARQVALTLFDAQAGRVDGKPVSLHLLSNGNGDDWRDAPRPARAES